MVSTFSKRRGSTWAKSLAGILLATAVGLVAGISSTPGQEQSNPRQLRHFVKTGIEFNKKGDYEMAAKYYSLVEPGKGTLTPTEQRDLDALVKQNNIALQYRRDAAGRIIQADQFLRQGRGGDANQILKQLKTNQYLSPQDKLAIGSIETRLRAMGPIAENTGPGPVLPQVPGKVDAKTLFADARAAYQRGDLDKAEELLKKAKDAKSWLMPWNPLGDNPHKLERDLEMARKSMPPSGGLRPAVATEDKNVVPEKKDSNTPLQKIKSLFGRKDGKDERKPINTPPLVPELKDDRKPMPPGPPMTPLEGPLLPPAPQSRAPDKSGNDVVAAADKKDTTTSAFSMRSMFPWAGGEKAEDKNAERKSPAPVPPTTAERLPPTSPENPPSAVSRPPLAAAAPKPETNVRLTVPPTAPPVEDPSITPAAARTVAPATPVNTEARRLVEDGYRALEANDIEQARSLANAARDLRPDLGWWEKNPAQLLAEIDRRTRTGKAAATVDPDGKNTKPAGAADARALMREARSLFQKDDLEAAEKAMSQAASLPGVRWGLFEDSPDRLRSDLQKARTRRSRDESAKFLAEARKLLAQGNLADAKTKALKAQELHGPNYTIWEMGDRADKLLIDIEKAELAQRKTPLPPVAKAGEPTSPEKKETEQQVASNAAGTAKKTATGAGQPGDPRQQDQDPSAVPADPAQLAAQAQARKAQAQALVAQAREMHRQGYLVESMQRAQQARQLQVPFEAHEDSPELVLGSLAAACDRRVQMLMQQSGELAVNSNDPGRFQKADALLTNARQLADAFGQDRSRIDAQAAWLRNAQAMAGGNAPARPDPKENTAPLSAEAQRARALGMEKLQQAHLELKNGNTPTARKIAEEVFTANCGLQEDATRMLRTIDAEEHNQGVLAANRNADAGMDAYKSGNFRQAATIFKGLDMRKLYPDKAYRIGEIMNTREMQPGSVDIARADRPAETPRPQDIVAVNPQNNTGRAQATDLPGKAHVSDEPLTERYRAMEEIQFQALRDKGLAAQRTSMERVRAGDNEGAVQVLQDFLTQLQTVQLDPERLALLKRPVESRLQQYRTVQAQKAMQDQQADLAKPAAQHNEIERVKGIEKTEQQVAELMNQFRSLMKEGRYRDAWAKANIAKELDPDNVAVDAALNIATIQHRIREQGEIKGENEKYFYEQLNMRSGPSLDMNHPMEFDKNRKHIIQKRTNVKDGYSTDRSTPTERAIRHKLDTPISLNFKETALKQVISDLRTLSGVNVVPDEEALRSALISLEQPMTLQVDNISLKSALNLLLKQVRLTYVIQNEVLTITTEDNAKGKLKQITYPVTDLVVPVQDYHPSPVFDLKEQLRNHANNLANMSGNGGSTPFAGPNPLVGGSTVSSPNSGFAGGQHQNMQNSGPSAWTKTASQTIEAQLIELITKTVAPSTWSAVGGPGEIQYFPLGMALVINQTQEVQEEVAALLAALRKLQDLEVAIEIKMVTVADNFFEFIGLDFDMNIFTNNSPKYENQLLTGQFQPFGRINTFQPARFVSGLTPAGTFTPDLGIPIRNSSFGFAAPPFGGYPGTLGADGGLALGLAFLSDIQVFMFLEAAQGDRRLNIMQAPRITVFNGQTAFLQVSDQTFMVTGVQPVQTGAGTFFVPQNQLIGPNQIQIQVTPVVSADRRFVRMAVNQFMSTMSGNSPLIPIQALLPQVFSGGVGGPEPQVLFQMFFQQPSFNTIFVNTTVNVPDGGTVVMGGLKTMSEARNEYGPPVLSKIPYVNRLFRNVGWGREAQTFMMMVTPRIIINEEEEQIFLGIIPPVPRP